MLNVTGSAPAARNERQTGGSAVRNWSWWLSGSALAGAVLFLCYLRVSDTVTVNSDGAGNALQAWSMLHGNPLMRGWWSTDVSYSTTAVPLLALIEAVVGLRPAVVHICAALCYTLLLLAAAFVARGRATGAAAAGRMAIAAVIMLAPEPGGAINILLNTPSHFISALPVLLVLLLLDWAPRRWWLPPAVGVLLVWGLVGDLIVLVIGVFPVAAVCLVRAGLAVLRSRTVRTAWLELSLVAAAGLAVPVAAEVNKLVAAAGGLQVRNLTMTPPLPGASVTQNTRSLLGLFGADLAGEPDHVQTRLDVALAMLHMVGVAAVLVAVLIASWRLLRTLASPVVARHADRESPDLVSDLLAVAVVVNVGIYYVIYRSTSFYLGEEVGAVLPLAAALAGRQLGEPVARAVLAKARTARALLVSAVVVVVACYGVALAHTAAQPKRPPGSHALASWLASHGLHHGLAGYWQANSVTLDTHRTVRLIAVAANKAAKRQVAPARWDVDMSQFDPRKHAATFLVLAPGSRSNLSQALRTFGRPAKTYYFESYTILVWHKNLLLDLPAPS